MNINNTFILKILSRVSKHGVGERVRSDAVRCGLLCVPFPTVGDNNTSVDTDPRYR